MIPRSLVTVIASIVTAVWVGAFILDALVPTYEVSPMIHAAFMATLGMAYTLGRNSDDKKDDDGPRHRKIEP